MKGTSPYAFEPHVLEWVILVAVATGYLALTRGGNWHATRRQRVCELGGLLLIGIVLGWPIGDLATHWSLLALVVQRLVLTLAVPPLLLLGLPPALITRASEPAPIDAVVRTLVRPPVAVAVVTITAVASLSVAAVDAQASSAAARGALDLALLFAGFVLWAPVLDVVPGRPMSAFGRAGYLVVQSIVPSFLSLVWIFARHPLYPPFAHSQHIAGMSPLLDQQLSGFVAKFLTIATLWTVAIVRLNRDHDAGGDPDIGTLSWHDVSRELARAERREQRARRRWLPPP